LNKHLNKEYMKIIQVYVENEVNTLLLSKKDDLTNDDIEKIVIQSSKMPEEEDALKFLNENGIERIFVDIEVYL
jgi:hypothetical protein